MNEIATTIREITQMHRLFKIHQKATITATLQIKGLCRSAVGGDKAEADVLYKSLHGNGGHHLTTVTRDAAISLLEMEAVGQKKCDLLQKCLETLAGGLPCYEWMKAIPGFGALNFAGEIAQVHGDNYLGPGDFSTVSKLWKMACAAVMPDGTRQRCVTDPAAALEHKYSPKRRAILSVLGDSLIRGNFIKHDDGTKEDGKYRKIYLARKEYEIEKAKKAGLTVRPQAKIPVKNREKFMSEGHVHNRAKRYMEKMLLKHLWCEWRKCFDG